jgi:hypothetical protein
VTANNPIADVLAAPLSPDWTVEGLAEQVLGAIAARRSEEAQEFVLDADATADRQARRLLRPLLACLATKAAAEAGTPATLYGGLFSFKRPGPTGPVWILGQFENRPGSVRVAFRRYSSPPPGERYGTVPGKPPAEVPETVATEEGPKADKRVKLDDPQSGPEALPRRTKR